VLSFLLFFQCALHSPVRTTTNLKLAQISFSLTVTLHDRCSPSFILPNQNQAPSTGPIEITSNCSSAAPPSSTMSSPLRPRLPATTAGHRQPSQPGAEAPLGLEGSSPPRPKKNYGAPLEPPSFLRRKEKKEEEGEEISTPHPL